MPDFLDLAAASGALRCERGHDEPMPGLGELRAFMQGTEHAPVPAAWTATAAKAAAEAPFSRSNARLRLLAIAKLAYPVVDFRLRRRYGR